MLIAHPYSYVIPAQVSRPVVVSGNRILSALTALLQRTTRRFSLGQLTITRCKDDDDEEEDDYDDDDDDNDDDDDDDDDDDVNDDGIVL